MKSAATSTPAASVVIPRLKRPELAQALTPAVSFPANVTLTEENGSRCRLFTCHETSDPMAMA